MQILIILLTASSVALAGIGGLYYSYACSVMPGLRRTDDATFVSAMSRINAAIQNPWFALSFFGAFLGLGGASIYSWSSGLSAAWPATLAWALYTITLVITIGVNIPLNNRLDVEAQAGDAGRARASFEEKWTRWNIHRTWISLASIISLSFSWTAVAAP